MVVVVVASWPYLLDAQAPYGDDNSAHLALMMHIAQLWRAGVTDLWWNQANLGLPLFMAYQPLPALASGSLAAFFTDTSAQITLFKGTIVALWALMPTAWYLGGRWLGLTRLQALLFGLFTLAIRDLHDVGFAFTAATYGGLYTQVWGMFFFPLTVGSFKQYLDGKEHPLVAPVSLFVVLSMSHLFCGMYAGIATLAFVATADGSRRKEYFRKALAVYGIALGLLAFWLGPLIATREFVGGLPWKDQYYNGWPLPELFHHLLGGDVFDDGRVPWLTVLWIAGVAIIVRTKLNWLNRWVICVSGVTLVLFMGRTNFGELYNLLPMHRHVNVMRYMNGIHYCGLIFAAIGGAAMLRWCRDKISPRLSANYTQPALIAAGIVVAGAYLYERGHEFRETLSTFNQRHPTIVQVLDELEAEPNHRIAVSEKLNTTAHFYRDLIPALSGRAGVQSYALGYHATLSTYYAEYMEFNRTWARLYNVGDYLAKRPAKDAAVSELEPVLSNDIYRLYEPQGSDNWHYFDFIETPVRVEGDFHDIRPGVRRIVVPGFGKRILPKLTGPTDRSTDADAPVLVTGDDRAIAWSDKGDWRNAMRKLEPARPKSTVLSMERGYNWYRADVRSRGKPEKLMLKVNYFPYWNATVDGEPAAVEHIAPNFMAVSVPPGKHTVKFTYRNPWWQKAGFLLTIFSLLSWGLFAWRRRR